MFLASIFISSKVDQHVTFEGLLLIACNLIILEKTFI